MNIFSILSFTISDFHNKVSLFKIISSLNKREKMSAVKTVSETNASGLTLIHRGKVRDVYRVTESELLLVATDRISAFDCILPTPIPYKGMILTALSAFWFERLKDLTANHLLTVDFARMPAIVRQTEDFRRRSTLVKKTEVFPVECVVRGYLEGSGWKDYQTTGKICGHQLPKNLQQGAKLPEPIFTPATKAASGHDENITETEFANIVGEKIAEKLKTLSLSIYQTASEYALTRGIIIADTKFEFGTDAGGQIVLIDEVLTPDSSRFWAAETYQPGKSQASFDKQFVRDYLETLDWNKQPPAPALPAEIVNATTSRYLEAYRILTGKHLITENFD